jgi:hypothetical protein
MNSAEYIQLLKNPEDINASNTKQLEEIVQEFPYFQSARSLLLKGLNKSNSYKYNPVLKKTAAYTIDRKVLFDFITSPIFITNKSTDTDELEQINIIDPEIVEIKTKNISKPSVPISIDKHDVVVKPIHEIGQTEQASEFLKLGKPIDFHNNEPHSFNEWMLLATQKPIVREEKKVNKFSIIDAFIESKPKIKPVGKNVINIDISQGSSTENDSLMTETLAKVYLEQKKYENAIKAYRILSLKYPEKSGFFADRIKAIKILQRNKL